MPKGSFRFELDSSDIKNLAKRARQMQKEWGEFLEQTASVCGEMAIGHLKEATPVQYGTLREAWHLAGVRKTSEGYVATMINSEEYSSYVNYGHMANPLGQENRWIPGSWSGDRFTYDPSSDEGMMLKQQWVNGIFFEDKGIEAFEVALPSVLAKKLENFMNEFDL